MSNQPRKKLPLALLEILQTDTDEDHRMLQAELLHRLAEGFGLTPTRKTLRHGLTILQEAGYPIAYNKGWYYEPDFCAAELDLLIDSVLFNPSVPPNQAHSLIQHLRRLGGASYQPSIGKSANKPVNPEFMYTYDVLHEAIRKQCRVDFHHGDWDVDKKMHLRTEADGTIKCYQVSPYAVLLHQGHAYLVGNVAKYDALTHFRLDRMLDIQLSEVPARPPADITGCAHPFDAQAYLNQHLHMFSGTVKPYHIKCKRYLAGDVLDWFGMDTAFSEISEDSVTAAVQADEQSLKYWLQMYGEHAEKLD